MMPMHIGLARLFKKRWGMDRRFVGARTVYGVDFGDLHAVVIGVGGVGSWVVEALARSGVGRLTLIDMDAVTLGNVNRQLCALDSTMGLDKVAVLAKRVQDINPDAVLDIYDEFLNADNVDRLLPDKSARSHTLVFECTDDMRAKTAVFWHCRYQKLPLVVAGGAGGKADVASLKIGDIMQARQDPLLGKMREKVLHAMTDKPKKLGALCVYADTPILRTGAGKLHCEGLGSAVAMTASMGMMMVGAGLLAWAQKQRLAQSAS